MPERIYIHEDERGTTHIDYDEVSPIFERFGNERVNEVARELDQKLEELAKVAAGWEAEKPDRPVPPQEGMEAEG